MDKVMTSLKVTEESNSIARKLALIKEGIANVRRMVNIESGITTLTIGRYQACMPGFGGV